MSDNNQHGNKEENNLGSYVVKVPREHCIKELSPDEWKTYWKHDPKYPRL